MHSVSQHAQAEIEPCSPRPHGFLGGGSQFPNQHRRKFFGGDPALLLFEEIPFFRQVRSTPKDLGPKADRLIEGEVLESLQGVEKHERADRSLERQQGSQLGNGLFDVPGCQRAVHGGSVGVGKRDGGQVGGFPGEERETADRSGGNREVPTRRALAGAGGGRVRDRFGPKRVLPGFQGESSAVSQSTERPIWIRSERMRLRRLLRAIPSSRAD